MFTNNKILLDSSLLVEYRKGSKRDLMRALLADTDFTLCITQTVVSEYLFYHLGIYGAKSPRTIQSNHSVGQVLTTYDPLPFLRLFSWATDDAAMREEAVRLMAAYNLLPNDALILSSCKQHNIKALASYDPDFVSACQAEGVALLQTTADFEQYKQQV